MCGRVPLLNRLQKKVGTRILSTGGPSLGFPILRQFNQNVISSGKCNACTTPATEMNDRLGFQVLSMGVRGGDSGFLCPTEGCKRDKPEARGCRPGRPTFGPSGCACVVVLLFLFDYTGAELVVSPQWQHVNGCQRGLFVCHFWATFPRAWLWSRFLSILWQSNIDLHLLNMFCFVFPFLVLKGIHHYWTYSYFSWGRN